jgi:RNA polymerase sigma-70 factor (ECF subfamily)
MVYKVRGGGEMTRVDLFFTLYQTIYDDISIPINNEPNDVVAQYGNMVYRLAFAKLQNCHDADDIFQEVFLRYIRRAPQFSNREHEKAWFLRTTINCCKNYWASAWQRKTTGLSEVSEQPVVYDNEDVQMLAEAMAKLAPKYRVVLHLYYYEGLTAEEIGKVQGLPAGTVRMQLSRARAMLKELLQQSDSELFAEGGGKHD